MAKTVLSPKSFNHRKHRVTRNGKRYCPRHEIARSTFALTPFRVVPRVPWFRIDLPHFRSAVPSRLDSDLYESTIQVRGGFYPKLSPGVFCIIDDFGVMQNYRVAVEDFGETTQ